MKDDAIRKCEGAIEQITDGSRLDLLRTPKQGRCTDYGDEHHQAQHCLTHTLHTLSSAPVQAFNTVTVTLLSRHISRARHNVTTSHGVGKGKGAR